LTHFLQHSPLLVLFGVAALGYLAGRIGWGGFSLGIAAVLFAGLLVGYALPGVELPDFVPQLGLVLFVYTVGIASGPGFFSSLKLRGLRDNALVLGVLLASYGLTLLFAWVLGLDGPAAAGLFAGALTNTPALAAVVEGLKSTGATGALLAAPVLGYSVCYPVGVLTPLLVVGLSDRWFRVAIASEKISRSYGATNDEPIVSATVRIENEPSADAANLRRTALYVVNFGRMRRGSVTSVVHDDTRFLPGDLVTVIGTRESVGAATIALGRTADEHLEYDRSEIDYRRMFVSNPDVTERPLSELDLGQRYDAVVTRVRRGDVDLVPDGHFELLLGDRARVLAPKARLHELEKLFGDSFRHLSEVDVITFGIGITLGLLLGAVKVPLPGGGTFSLGIAGGPLVVGLLLGRAGRTGRLVWTPPYGVNLTLRQFGAVLFLAGVGLKAGGALGTTTSGAMVLQLFGVGALVSGFAALSVMLVGRFVMKIPVSVLVGILAGLETQPAVLAFAVEKAKRDVPNIGYAAVYPLAMIAKILLAQALLHGP
jgi:putative transport protein